MKLIDQNNQPQELKDGDMLIYSSWGTLVFHRPNSLTILYLSDPQDCPGRIAQFSFKVQDNNDFMRLAKLISIPVGLNVRQLQCEQGWKCQFIKPS